MNSQTKKFVQLLIVLLVGGFFIYYAFKGIEWDDLLNKISGANFWWLSLGMGVSLISHWLRAYRATMLYEAMNYKISTKNSLLAVLIGYMMNYFIPRAGEVSRCAALSKTDNLPLEKGIGSVVTERLVDMALLILILGAIFLLQFDLIIGFIDSFSGSSQTQANTSSWKFIILGAIILFLLGAFIFRKRLLEMPIFIRIFGLLQGFADGLLSIRHLKNPTLFIILSAGIWIGYILMMYFCLFSLNATSNLSFADCLTVFAIGTIGVVLPAPGAGAGTYHFFVMQSLLLYGVAKDDGIAYATLVHGTQMVIIILLGLAASAITYFTPKINDKTESDLK